ncbi:hypothetical protein ABZ054_08070, partial [Streptomyces sp. NPDC006324]
GAAGAPNTGGSRRLVARSLPCRVASFLGATLVTGSEAGAETQWRTVEGSGGVYVIGYRVIDI